MPVASTRGVFPTLEIKICKLHAHIFQFSEVKFLTTLFLVGCEAKCTGGEREGHHDSGWRIFIVLSLSFVFAFVICLYFVVSLFRFACVVFMLIKGGFLTLVYQRILCFTFCLRGKQSVFVFVVL